MAKYITTMRVKLDAKRRVMAGEVIDLSAKAAEPLLAAKAIELYRDKKSEADAVAKAKAEADAAAAAEAEAQAKADAEAKAKAEAEAAAAGQQPTT